MKYKYCTFRLDDVTPAMDWQKFSRLTDTLEQYNIKPLIGVVPDNKDIKLNRGSAEPDFWQIVKEWEKRGWTIAQHGYQHLYVTDSSGILKKNARSEFAALNYSQQIDKLREGRKVLAEHGIQTDIFMAPAHSYDKNTLRALRDCGFKYVTDGYTRYPYDWRGLKFIPCMHVLPKEIKGLTTCCLHSNTTEDKFFGEIENFIRNNRDFIIDYKQALDLNSDQWGLVWQPYFILLTLLKKIVPVEIRHLIRKII